MMMAAIDAGSNTLRLLIGCVIDGRVVPERYVRRICRLAGGFTQEKGLSSQARERTLLALQEFVDVCRLAGIEQIRTVGTAAFRQAVNGPAFANEIQDKLGIPFEIISGDREAYYTAKGVLSTLTPVPFCSLIVDIGGGSTEFVLCAQQEVLWSSSIPLGVVRLTEDYRSSPLRMLAIENTVAGVKDEVQTAFRSAGFGPAGMVLVGTAGTVTTLAALDMQMKDYDWRRVNNFLMPLSRLNFWQTHLAPMSLAERESLPGMEPGRGDLITAGLEILLCLMSHFKADSLTVSDFGLLEGLLISQQKSSIPWSFH